MDEKSIVTIREELADDFFALAKNHRDVVQKLIETLEDDQLDTQLQFERYEQERRWKEAKRRVEAINVSDEEAQPQPKLPKLQPDQQPERAAKEQIEGAE